MKAISDGAENLANKAMRDGVIAIFYVGGVFKSTKLLRPRAIQALEQDNHILMGIYNRDVDAAWIEEDMQYMLGEYSKMGAR